MAGGASSAGTAALAADIGALIDAIALKTTVELGAEVDRLRGAVAIRYRTPLEPTWPRTVSVSVDVIGAGLDATASGGASLGEPHRAHAFGCDVETNADAIAAAGYEGCWNTQNSIRSGSSYLPANSAPRPRRGGPRRR